MTPVEHQLNMEKGEEEYKQAWIGMRDKDGGGVNFQVKHVFFVEQILRTPLWVFFISKWVSEERVAKYLTLM